MASFPWYVSIPVVLIATTVLGVAIERVAYKPLRTAPRMSVMQISDRIYVLDFGRQIAQGTPDEIQNNPKVIDAYLGVGDEDA